MPADTDTVTLPEALPTTAVGVPGVPGGRVGVTAVDGLEDPEVPSLFDAVAVNVYDVPFVNPVTAHEVAGTVIVRALVLSSTVVTV